MTDDPLDRLAKTRAARTLGWLVVVLFAVFVAVALAPYVFR